MLRKAKSGYAVILLDEEMKAGKSITYLYLGSISVYQYNLCKKKNQKEYKEAIELNLFLMTLV